MNYKTGFDNAKKSHSFAAREPATYCRRVQPEYLEIGGAKQHSARRQVHKTSAEISI